MERSSSISVIICGQVLCGISSTLQIKSDRLAWKELRSLREYLRTPESPIEDAIDKTLRLLLDSQKYLSFSPIIERLLIDKIKNSINFEISVQLRSRISSTPTIFRAN